uniref:glycosyltransferase family 4 protein n=1 Tax=Microbulbifer agarilyticus TaxID=260552 RepID=UPI000255B9B7|nr:glycosyltransferase family 4 protein [Microbulbifer agarilyticus]
MIQTICHLIASREHGGLEKHVADLSHWQACNRDVQVAVIAHPRYLSTLDERIQFIPLNTDRSRLDPNLVWRLSNLIRKGEYQIVHGHGSKSAQLLAAVKPFTETQQVITRHNVRHPRDKLASAFDARIAISENIVANSKLTWNIIPYGVASQTDSSPNSGSTGKTSQIFSGRESPRRQVTDGFTLDAMGTATWEIYSQLIPELTS